MIVKLARKKIYEKCLVVFICLLVFGNLAHGAVPCISADEYVSIELRPADCCNDCLGVPVQPFPDSCGQCIDTPIYTGLGKINRLAKQLNSTFPTPAVIVPSDKLSLSAYSSASSAFDAVSYFTSLRAVILQI